MDQNPKGFASPFALLLRVNFLQMWRQITHAGTRSGTLSVMVAMFLLFYPLIASGMFWGGLRYISKFPGLGDLLIEHLIFLLFAMLFTLLLFSNVVVGYTNMFRNQETRFLQTLPFSANHIFQWKLVETTIFASWAFLLLIAPLIIAYGIHQKATLGFYLITPFLVILFIILPAIFGCWIAVFMARYLDRSLFQTTAVLLLLFMVYTVKVYLQPEAATEQTLETRVLDLTDRLLSKTQFAQLPFLPSYWLSSTLTNWVDGARALTQFFIAVLTANVLFFGFLGFTETGKYFYKSLSATLSRGSLAGDWSQAISFAPRMCAQVILLAWFLPMVDFSSLKEYWQEKFKPIAANYAAQKNNTDISVQTLGLWTTNQVLQIEPRLAQGSLFPLKPEIRRLYERFASGEMQQLGPDLEYLISANLHSTLSGLDIVRGRNHLRGQAMKFAAEPEATLMPKAPDTVVDILRTTSRPLIDKTHLSILKGTTDPDTNTIYRLYYRRLIEEVDAESKPTGKKIYITDFGNYFEGYLTQVEENQLRLTFASTNFNDHIRGVAAQEFWQDTEDTAINLDRWALAQVVSSPETVALHTDQRAPLPSTVLLIIPLLAIVSWIINSQTTHLFAGVGILVLMGTFAVQSEQWRNLVGGETNLSIVKYIGGGAWIIVIMALSQACCAVWQTSLNNYFQSWYQKRSKQKEVFTFQPGLMDRLLQLSPLLSPDVRAVILKDIRIFWRDTAQWGQSLILFAILGIYILNLRFFTEQFTSLFSSSGRFGGDYFSKLVSFMNLAACALNLATLTTRFVFPQFSLEGKRLWIVGLSPLGLNRVVLVKYLLATTISLAISIPLIWLSSNMLQMPIAQKLFFCGSIAVMALALNGLAMGMGVIYPDLKEDNPSKIVSGFGGTFCLVVSFVYIGMAVMMLGIGSPFGSPWQVFGRANETKQLIYIGLFLVFSLAVGFGPLAYGLRKARYFEH